MVKRKAAVLVVGGTLLVAVIGGIAWFLYWNSLPPQQFACWPPVTVDEDRSRTLVDEVSKPYSSTDPHSTISLTVDEVKKNKDGSGFLTYTLTNTADPNDPTYRERKAGNMVEVAHGWITSTRGNTTRFIPARIP